MKRKQLEIDNILIKGRRIYFHGTPAENLESILRDVKRKETLFGHFFCIGDKERMMSRKKFYQRLFSSIYVAVGYSKPTPIYKPKEKRIYVARPPTIICVVRKERGDIEKRGNPWFSFYGETFPVEHDPPIIHKPPEIESYVFPMSTNEEDLKRINEEFRRKHGKGVIVNETTTAIIFWTERNAEIMIRKLNEELENCKIE